MTQNQSITTSGSIPTRPAAVLPFSSRAETPLYHDLRVKHDLRPHTFAEAMQQFGVSIRVVAQAMVTTLQKVEDSIAYIPAMPHEEPSVRYGMQRRAAGREGTRIVREGLSSSLPWLRLDDQ